MKAKRAGTKGALFPVRADTHPSPHVATTVEKLLDYVTHTPPDARRSKLCVDQRCELIGKNLRRRK